MGFESRHRKRDLELPKYRESLLTAIENDLFNDDYVLAFFYGGSIGNENTDVFSDIDLRVVVKPGKIKGYISNKKNRASTWGNVLYFEDLNPHANYTIAHYDCFIKVDVFYYTPDEIHPSVWLQNIKILKDSEEMMANVLKQSMCLTYKPSLDEFENWRSKFFAYLHEAYRRALREEYYYALDCLDKLRLSMVTAWYMDGEVQPNTFGDWAKYEGSRSKLDDEQKLLLESWNCRRDTNEIINVMKDIVHEFKQVHHSLCKKLNSQEDLKRVNRIVNMVL